MKRTLVLGLALVALCFGYGLAETLPAPQNLKVELRKDTVKGRWDPIKGASYYEVWTQAFGKWRYDEKGLASSPFTSSFELPLSDGRTRYKVRAVGPDGEKSGFSNEAIAAELKPENTSTSKKPDYSKSGKTPGFDPKAPPPEPPTSLFAVWNGARDIRLVWQGAENAKKFTVEEFKDGKWISVARIKFPKKNTALISNHPMPGPYKFRVRAVGKNGRASRPSRPTTAKR